MKPYVIKGMILSLVLGLFACYPGGPEFIDQLDLVYTDYDDTFDFQSNVTYALPDGVIEIDDEDPDGPPEFIEEVYSEAILDRLRANLNARGYTEVDEDLEDPDLVVLASAMSTTNLYWFYDPCYWCWWGPWWGPGYGWGYPWYPGGGYVSGYTTGTIFIQLVSTDDIVGEEVPVAWTATINGLLQGSEQNKLGRIDNTIDQAFDQSPYLEK